MPAGKIRLALRGPCTTHFHRLSGQTSYYHEFLFYDDGDLAVFGYDDMHVTRPFSVNGELVFDKAFKAFRVQHVGATFTTIVIFTVDDSFLGYYSDTTLPWSGVHPVEGSAGEAFETDIVDLFLDHFIFPDGRRFILDVGELFEGLAAGKITEAQGELALATAGWMEEEAAAGRYPGPFLQGIDLDPKLLSGLPRSQE